MADGSVRGINFNIDGETYISDKGSIADRQVRRYARKVLSGFRYKYLKQVGYDYCQGRTYYTGPHDYLGP